MNVVSELYSIKQFSELTGFTEDAIRYYEKIGLLQEVKRKDNRHRIYDAEDINRMVLIACLKKTGMSLDEMKLYVLRTNDDDINTVTERDEILKGHKQRIEQQMIHLQTILDFIDFKLLSGKKMGEYN
ncbi:MerR family transcriptional regulator [Paenibacillus sp. 19GGS1-52]|uniref:MerR family transcriptional regulator n=1 Tax=Paenibacillus sp. 19GGS1-52 TaxID=2758563 RepID=UPI001EFA52C3|nr:MerR family transcriptional regulator [Paenibacillus sp. 19GGS1-52]ULO05039.1 MerR family transcriptional regulator [Paenibacillus sp. 19GGS1-52]